MADTNQKKQRTNQRRDNKQKTRGPSLTITPTQDTNLKGSQQGQQKRKKRSGVQSGGVAGNGLNIPR